MHLSIPSVFVALQCAQTPQSSYSTTNFVVEADSAEVAKAVAESAEECRIKLAKLWYGKVPADWCVPCRIQVTITLQIVAGVSEVAYAGGTVSSQRIAVQGPLTSILKGPLPHEMTHVLFAHQFGFQPPRWADEGGAILSEDSSQARRQNRQFRKILAEERNIALRRLLDMRQYPDDKACLYAQGYSIARFLVGAKGHSVFLAFVRDGLARGWDKSVHAHYGYTDVEHLENAWLTSIEKEPQAVRSEE
jgi:hypothetical protein